jgi:hypothetical protein
MELVKSASNEDILFVPSYDKKKLRLQYNNSLRTLREEICIL